MRQRSNGIIGRKTAGRQPLHSLGGAGFEGQCNKGRAEKQMRIYSLPGNRIYNRPARPLSGRPGPHRHSRRPFYRHSRVSGNPAVA